VIFDGHSIKSELPWLFDGRLPALCHTITYEGE